MSMTKTCKTLPIPYSPLACAMEVRGWVLFLFFIVSFALAIFFVYTIDELSHLLDYETQRADYATRQLERLTKECGKRTAATVGHALGLPRNASFSSAI